MYSYVQGAFALDWVYCGQYNPESTSYPSRGKERDDVSFFPFSVAVQFILETVTRDD